MKQHFEARYFDKIGLYQIRGVTVDGMNLSSENTNEIFFSAPKNEITQGCINRIVDNLNKLAEHAAKNGQ